MHDDNPYAASAGTTSGSSPEAGDLVPLRPVPGDVLYPADRWKCLRFAPVSGRYEGAGSSALVIRQPILDLRVDIDPIEPNAIVTNRISGDLWENVMLLSGTGGLAGVQRFKRVYRNSWIVDNPSVQWKRCEVSISGTVRFWKGGQPATTIAVRIPWSSGTGIGPAEVTLTPAGGTPQSFTCPRKSSWFRDVNLEVDVCQSVNAAPLPPSYDTHAHPTRPADLPRRTLSVEAAYREAGINLSVAAGHSVINDSASQFASWSVAELHDAMETHFSLFTGSWPAWQMWGLMAGRYDNAGTGGIMFDYSGAMEPPERQGFAVFRNHSWFNNLVAGAPANDDQAWAMRHFLYTWVHEAGHAFNFLHSWDKSRPDALSWMNYDWRYDQRNGNGSYWAGFRFRFDDEELLHMRHGDRAAVIMGGDPWSSGSHMDAPPAAYDDGAGALELTIRSKGYFEFMEPVSVELRLRNLDPAQPKAIDARLAPEQGRVKLVVLKPDARVLGYHPMTCMLGESVERVLAPAGVGKAGEDRYSEEVFIAYGGDGFYFAEPGEYMIRAMYEEWSCPRLTDANRDGVASYPRARACGASYAREARAGG
jgi:hypothetical protein